MDKKSNEVFEMMKESSPMKRILKDYNQIHSSHLLLGYLQHHVTEAYSTATIEQAPESSPENESQVISAIRELITKKGEKSGEDIWSTFIVPRREAVLASILKSDAEAKAILGNMFDTPLGEGIEYAGADVNRRLNEDEDYRESLKLFHIDALISLAEYLGVIHIENREQNRCGDIIYSDPDEIWDKIEKKLGVPIRFPSFKGGLFSVRTRRGHFTNRDCIYLYIAIRLREMLSCAETPVCELGSGVGYLAYYCYLMGIKNVTLVDIPSVRATAACFLMQNMQGTRFFFSDCSECWSNAPGIRLVLPEHLGSVPRQHFEVLVNCDSLPEMSADVATDYVQRIPSLCRNFLSINQEAAGKMWHLDMKQNKVSELVNTASGFQRVSRNLFWLRKGYVEEVYRCDE
jgi:hypothetical protein